MKDKITPILGFTVVIVFGIIMVFSIINSVINSEMKALGKKALATQSPQESEILGKKATATFVQDEYVNTSQVTRGDTTIIRTDINKSKIAGRIFADKAKEFKSGLRDSKDDVSKHGTTSEDPKESEGSIFKEYLKKKAKQKLKEEAERLLQ